MCEDCQKKHPPKSDCWPGDQDYLDGAIELFLPSEKYLKAYWDADIIDDDKNPQDTIIESNEAFNVRFRVELKGGCGSVFAVTGASISASRPWEAEKTSICPMSCHW